MRNSKHIVIMFVALLCAMLPSLGVAQTRERFGISAKAGGVNNVVGRVRVTRKDQLPQVLTSTDDLAANETVTTASSSNAEILLNPGSYLRLGENSEFQFEDISLDNLRLRLLKGSAIIEATGVADMDLGIKIATENGEFTILRSGVYRVDVRPGFAEMAVRKGRASFGPTKTDIVKGGKVVTLTNGGVAVANLTKDKDAFDGWSKQRAELLAQANARLMNRSFNGYLSSFSGWDSWFWGPRRFGLWTYSARAGCYTFLPFYYGWSSPYGHGYGNYYWRGSGCCNNYNNQGNTIVGTPNGSGNNPTGGNPTGVRPTTGGGPTGVWNPGSGPSTPSVPREIDAGGIRMVNKRQDP
ncbi:MAG TPA: FecR domain-containing protein [Pyrinomonadaceae bacterium]